MSTGNVVRMRGPKPARGASIADYGEVHASQEFARRFAERFRYCPDWRQWLQWDDTRWARDVAGAALLAAKKLCQELADIARGDLLFGENAPARERAALRFESRKTVESVLALATVEPALVVLARDLDADPWLLNTPAGTIDLRDGTMREHNRADNISLCTALAPAEGPRPTFDRFMADITCGDRWLAEYLQTALGACLSGAIDDHWLMFWHGPGRNGKNTLGDTVLRILGDYARVVPTQMLMADAHGNRHPTELTTVRAIRIAFSSEVAEGEHWSETRVKSATGDAVITARYMRGDFFEFPRTHKHVVYGNHRPMLRIVDPAIAARLHLVPFNASFTAELGNLDPDMPAKLWAEAPQILDWLIYGHALWREDGGLKRCAAVEQATRDYLDSQSTLEQWIAERLEEVTDDGRPGRDWPRSGELYRDYAAWKRDRGEQPYSETRWSEQMKRRFRWLRADGSRFVGVRRRDPMEAPE